MLIFATSCKHLIISYPEPLLDIFVALTLRQALSWVSKAASWMINGWIQKKEAWSKSEPIIERSQTTKITEKIILFYSLLSFNIETGRLLVDFE